MKMVKRNSRRKETPKPHTSAWMAFEQNLGSISHMLALSHREAVRLKRQAVRTTGLFTPTPDLTAALTKKKLLRSLKRFLKTVSTGIERFQTISLWQIVMLVTCVEAYLQDVLAAAAAVDPQLMHNSEQHARYPDVIDATSLDALAAVMRTRWARNWLNPGGPTRWIGQLTKMGVSGYPSNLGPRLELFWGIRHLAVHSAGVATPDFVKRHPLVVKAVGDRVKVNAKYFKTFNEAVLEFLTPTEEYFLQRYPALKIASPAS
jgi:hypothetical protein